MFYKKHKVIKIMKVTEDYSGRDSTVCVVSHGSNVSAGVAALFSPKLTVLNIKSCEVELEKILILNAKIKNVQKYSYINAYAPNHGSNHIKLYKLIN